MLSNVLLSIVTVASTITLASAGKQRTSSSSDVYCNFQCPTFGRTDVKTTFSGLVSTDYQTLDEVGTFTCGYKAKGAKTAEVCTYSGTSGYLKSATADICPSDALPAYFQCMKSFRPPQNNADAWEEEMHIQVKRRAGATLGPGGDGLKRMIHSARGSSYERKKGIAEMKKRAMRDERSKYWY